MPKIESSGRPIALIALVGISLGIIIFGNLPNDDLRGQGTPGAGNPGAGTGAPGSAGTNEGESAGTNAGGPGSGNDGDTSVSNGGGGGGGSQMTCNKKPSGDASRRCGTEIGGLVNGTSITDLGISLKVLGLAGVHQILPFCDKLFVTSKDDDMLTVYDFSDPTRLKQIGRAVDKGKVSQPLTQQAKSLENPTEMALNTDRGSIWVVGEDGTDITEFSLIGEFEGISYIPYPKGTASDIWNENSAIGGTPGKITDIEVHDGNLIVAYDGMLSILSSTSLPEIQWIGNTFTHGNRLRGDIWNAKIALHEISSGVYIYVYGQRNTTENYLTIVKVIGSGNTSQLQLIKVLLFGQDISPVRLARGFRGPETNTIITPVIIDEYLYAGGLIFDISSPESPRTIGAIGVPATFSGKASYDIDGNTAYLVSGKQLLSVHDISDPLPQSAPFIDEISSPLNTLGSLIAIQNGLGFVFDESRDQLHIVDVTNCPLRCGNSAVQGNEECDDGNTQSDDGCSASCEIENGYTCTPQEPSVCSVCGDGVIAKPFCGNQICEAPERFRCPPGSRTVDTRGRVYRCTICPQDCDQVPTVVQCDDGNTADGDGCSALCFREEGFTCENEPSDCSSTCGDGNKAADEECDDSNTTNGDGCSALCKEEGCGNGRLDQGEECDDGNTAASDGCSSQCTVEGGFSCEEEPSECSSTCGDSVIASDEVCDDGNTASNDGCNASCSALEEGFNCNNAEPTVCTNICGDGLVRTPEGCDDDGQESGDGCSSTCTVEPGFTCQGEPSSCVTGCGDGTRAGAEECDDGNTAAGDGCSEVCETEECGNNREDSGETCDDGNTTEGDGCDSNCITEQGFTCTEAPSTCNSICGDSLVRTPEACDDGNRTDDDGCNSSCQVEDGFSCSDEPSRCTTTCGDGVQRGSETCDDGNTTAGDGCSATCSTEPGFSCNEENPSVCSSTCGDGILRGDEECDDGNLGPGDGCDVECKIEEGFTCISEPSRCTANDTDDTVVVTDDDDEADPDTDDTVVVTDDDDEADPDIDDTVVVTDDDDEADPDIDDTVVVTDDDDEGTTIVVVEESTDDDSDEEAVVVLAPEPDTSPEPLRPILLQPSAPIRRVADLALLFNGPSIVSPGDAAKFTVGIVNLGPDATEWTMEMGLGTDWAIAPKNPLAAQLIGSEEPCALSKGTLTCTAPAALPPSNLPWEMNVEMIANPAIKNLKTTKMIATIATIDAVDPNPNNNTSFPLTVVIRGSEATDTQVAGVMQEIMIEKEQRKVATAKRIQSPEAPTPSVVAYEKVPSIVEAEIVEEEVVEQQPRKSECGNGFFEPPEECDSGDKNSNLPSTNCYTDCTVPKCGDGIVNPSEDCDDGNTRQGDGCDNRCRIEEEKVEGRPSQVAGVFDQQQPSQIPVPPPQQQYPYPQAPQGFNQFAPFPQYPSMQPLPFQFPLAQLQPLATNRAPMGDTGPAAIFVAIGGAASGITWMRRRKK